jgi:hypothetical protein
MRRVYEIYHRCNGFIRNLTDTPIQFGCLINEIILDPWPEPVEGLPSPMWEAAPELPAGVFYADSTGIYRQDLPVRPGNWGGVWSRGVPQIFAPVLYVVPEGTEIPEGRKDLKYPWQI